MNNAENSEATEGKPSGYSSFKTTVRFFTFINFFLALILISDFFLEPEYREIDKAADSAKSKTFSLSLGGDSLKIHSGDSEKRENEMAVFTPIFQVEAYHKYKAGSDDGYSVDLGTVFLPAAAALVWLISFIVVIITRKRKNGPEPLLKYQILLLPVIVSLSYWAKLLGYFL
jgi:hypothetical protein